MPDSKGRLTPQELWELEQSDYSSKQKELTPKEESNPKTSLSSKAETIGARLARVATSDFADEGVAGFKTGSLPGMQDSESIPEYLGARAAETFIPGYKAAQAASKVYSKEKGLDKSDYNAERDKMREYFKKTAEANPELDTAANIGGNTLLALTPMGAIGRGASIGSAALKSGALGALQGAGESEADTMSGVAKDAAIGGAISGALGGASQGLSKGLSKGFDAVKSKLMAPTVKEAIQETGEATAKLTPIEKLKVGAAKFMGVNKDDAPILLKNADDIARLQAAGTSEQQFINAVKQNTKSMKQLSNSALSKLSADRNIHVSSLDDVLDKAAISNRRIPVDMEGKQIAPKEVLGATDVSNPEKEAAINDVRKLIGGMTEKNPNLSEKEIKGVIQQLDAMTSYDALKANQKSDLYGNQIKEIRKALDTNLKTANPAYAADMEKLAPITKTQSLLGKRFGITKDINDEAAFDQAAKKIQMIQKNTKPNQYRAEERILKRLDPNLPRDISLRGVDERNVGGITQGSRNVNLGGISGLVAQSALGGGAGAIVGGLGTESPYGAGAGAIVGGILDKQGRQLGKQLLMSSFGRGGKASITATAKAANVPIEAAIRNAETPGVSKIMGFAGTPFFDRLQQAMTRGGAAYIQEDFILNNDPEYRAIKRRQNNGETK